MNMVDYRKFDGWVEPMENLKVDVDLLIQEYNDHVAPLNVDRKPQPDDHIVGKNLRWEDFYDDYTDGPRVLVHQRFKIHDVSELLPYTAQVIEQVRTKFKFTHVHYRSLLPNTCFGWHRDEMEVSVHIPLITNPGSWFIFDEKQLRMPANGDVYIVNNGRYHTFVNAGPEPRVHITFFNY